MIRHAVDLAVALRQARGVIYGLGRLVGVALVAVLVSLLTEVITVESGSPLVSASLRIALGVALLGFASGEVAAVTETDRRCPAAHVDGVGGRHVTDWSGGTGLPVAGR